MTHPKTGGVAGGYPHSKGIVGENGKALCLGRASACAGLA